MGQRKLAESRMEIYLRPESVIKKDDSGTKLIIVPHVIPSP